MEMSFTKKYFTFLVVLEVIIFGITCGLAVLSADPQPMYWIITAISAELSIFSAFYTRKALAENRAKYAQQYVTDFADKYGLEAALRISEMVLREN